eukprot:TRINITY_DN45308_c0_g1_i2.p3 TRINITY_DN45308_c0_g1~~TRINITY_DN45308_c0_g1_i2.p3  ORF type:complete len:125 (+),score=34.31 TRINITY_DN45308_c0_g1_i2:87-461(+)
MGLRLEGSLRVACCSVHESGHLNPVLHIAQAVALCGRGHKVQVFTPDYATARVKKKVEGFGAEFMALPTTMTEEELQADTDKKQQTPFPVLRDMMLEPLRKYFQAQRPDVIVADFMTLAPMMLS